MKALALLTLITTVLAGCGKQSDTSPNSPAAAVSASGESSLPKQPFEVVTSSGVEMVFLPDGEFTMGTGSSGNPDEAPAHKVKLTGFLIDKFEVTQELFAKAQLPNPSHWNENPRKPVERVRWRDAKQYCNERSILEGLKPCYNEKTPDWDCDYSADGYRLPTEAEWEFAARAGTQGDFEFGQADKLRMFSWFGENSNEQSHPVGQKKPNRWGIHDLYGNVSEWCEDVYSPDYYRTSPSLDPLGPPSPGKDVQRVMRGGSWKSSADMCRVAFRQGQKTGDTDACFFTDYCGFRCVRRPGAGQLEKMQRAK
jgi:formylglycine-generating enzyme required for sulfatase activity